ncbi:MAG: hypothetical protein OXF48_03920, partial [Bacteroidetes bacterium]|nr:hypothetical protein [Bacteroidota bacterium]
LLLSLAFAFLIILSGLKAGNLEAYERVPWCGDTQACSAVGCSGYDRACAGMPCIECAEFGCAYDFQLCYSGISRE